MKLTLPAACDGWTRLKVLLAYHVLQKPRLIVKNKPPRKLRTTAFFEMP